MRDLKQIPGVGEKMAQHLIQLGYSTVASLKGADPEELYAKDCVRCGVKLDRCVLYVYRCAVYYASTPAPKSEKLKWWNWKD